MPQTVYNIAQLRWQDRKGGSQFRQGNADEMEKNLVELKDYHREVLKHLAGGGLIAVRMYGKRTTTIETHAEPRCIAVGLMSLEKLHDAGLIRPGEASPFKSGKSVPYVLTDEGRKEAAA